MSSAPAPLAAATPAAAASHPWSGYAAGLLLLSTLGLGACGGGAAPAANAAADAPPAGAQAVDAQALPTYHLAPLALAEPSDVDADGSGMSAYLPAHQEMVPAMLRQLRTARLTPETIDAAMARAAVTPAVAAATPLSVLTPAQVRSAYLLPTLPAASAKPTAAQAASMGSGQTIYIIDANSSPNVAADLATFDAKFGLPTCTAATLPASTKLPLAAAAAGSSCVFDIAYASSSGGLTNTAPAYDSGWAVEINMDVQWVHATAPMARIVLIEAAGASVSQLGAAISLANAMGPGVVSMSFGAGEGSWISAEESLFSTSGKMGYVASTGDSGAGVAWPSASPSVLAVGGTTLAYTGTGSRSETVWSQTGGGISAYVLEPSWQALLSVPGEPTSASAKHMRSVADVAFNADPNSGQYLVVTAAGAKTATWYSGGGTSLGTPQWAALVAVANAQRAAAGKAVLGEPMTALYKGIGAVKGNYASAFLDVRSGKDGTCAVCVAATGYDAPTGLGTPNASTVLSQLTAY